jgi:hypothetical protein
MTYEASPEFVTLIRDLAQQLNTTPAEILCVRSAKCIFNRAW